MFIYIMRLALIRRIPQERRCSTCVYLVRIGEIPLFWTILGVRFGGPVLDLRSDPKTLKIRWTKLYPPALFILALLASGFGPQMTPFWTPIWAQNDDLWVTTHKRGHFMVYAFTAFLHFVFVL